MMDTAAAAALLLSKPLAIDPAALWPAIQLCQGDVQAAAALTTKPGKPEFQRDGSVAVVPVTGFLSQNPGFIERVFLGATSYGDVVEMTEAAVSDSLIRSIVLDIDSTGGAASGCLECGAAIAALAKRKAITAFVSDTAASAAYAVAVGAREIHVAPTARVGSIGVILTSANYTAALEAAGIDVKVLHSGELKAAGHPHKPRTQPETDHLQSSVDQLGELFRQHVTAYRRGVPRSAMEGQMFIGAQAVAMKLADKITNSLHSHTRSLAAATITARARTQPFAMTKPTPTPTQARETDPARIFDASPVAKQEFGFRDGFCAYWRAVLDGRQHDPGFATRYGIATFTPAERHAATTGQKPDGMAAKYFASPEFQKTFTSPESFAAYARGVEAGSIRDAEFLAKL